MNNILDDKIIAGLMAITDFKLAPEMVRDVSNYCDYMILRYDEKTGNKKIFDECTDIAKNHNNFCRAYSENKDFNRWNWRESLIRRLDHLKPDYVIFLDEDEMLGYKFIDDFKIFTETGLNRLEFLYTMVTENDVNVPLYPYRRHTKVFRWFPGITYKPYRNFARPNFPKETKALKAVSKIEHFCFYNKKMRKEKIIKGHIKWNNKIKKNTVGKTFEEIKKDV